MVHDQITIEGNPLYQVLDFHSLAKPALLLRKYSNSRDGGAVALLQSRGVTKYTAVHINESMTDPRKDVAAVFFDCEEDAFAARDLLKGAKNLDNKPILVGFRYDNCKYSNTESLG